MPRISSPRRPHLPRSTGCRAFMKMRPRPVQHPRLHQRPRLFLRSRHRTAAPAVAKAKPAMPLPSRADAATNNPHGPDQDARLLRSQIAPGQIGGYVVDPSGAVVANARVTITPTPSKGETATAVTNSQGAWLIAGLPTGNYKAEAEAPGFNTTVLDLNYDANRPSLYSLTLSPGTVSETVEVSAQAAQVQATTSSATGRAGYRRT